MYQERQFRCLSCKKTFTLSDGIIIHQPTGVECPHCGSCLTVEQSYGRAFPPRDY